MGLSVVDLRFSASGTFALEMGIGDRKPPIASSGAQPYTMQIVHVRKRDIRIGMRIAAGQMVSGVSRMKCLTFTIDPTARWSARDCEPRALLNLLPLCWTPHPSAGSRPESFLAPAPTVDPAASPSRVMRNLLQARMTCATHAIRRTRHTVHQSYSISTTQNGNGMWVAAFGRRDRDLIRTDHAKQAILETAPEVAEVIALAEAQITIDDLVSKAR